MAKKTVGYVHLVWPCPRCQTRNPGPQKFCNGCGGPQPADVQFEQPAEEKLLSDAQEIARARAGPDVHCPYCGARNPAGAKFCGGCGGDLAEGQARARGRVLGAHKDGPAPEVACKACGTLNPPDADRCRSCGAGLAAQPAAPARPATRAGRGLGLAVALGALACLLGAGALIFLSSRSQALEGSVRSVEWTREVEVEAYVPVEGEAWRDEIPEGAALGGCVEAQRATVDEPVPGALEVCGTPYTVDTGSGYGEVVQDCVYEVYDAWCSYTGMAWEVVEIWEASESDLEPFWPEVELAEGQRLGQGAERYHVVFSTAEGDFSYTPTSAGEFTRYRIGSVWVIEVNALGGIVNLSPAP